MKMRRLLIFLLGILVLLALLLINYYGFSIWLRVDYFDWYLANGALFGIATTAVTMVWGKMAQHTGLISANPWHYLGSYLQLVGLPLYVFGAHLRGDERSTRNGSLFDAITSVVLLLALSAVLLLWLIVVVPLQYFVYLVCGAPARLFHSSQRQTIAKLDVSRLQMKEITKQEQQAPAGWWNASVTDKPVAVTGLFSSLFFLVVKSFWG